jgi:transketolase
LFSLGAQEFLGVDCIRGKKTGEAMSRPNSEKNEFFLHAQQTRADVLRMIHLAKSSHAGSALSMIDLLTVLYEKVLRIDPSRPDWPARDRFILSKGHACAGLYAVLASRGFFPKDWLSDFYRDGARLAGHATSTGIPGVEVSTGALGHGLAIGCGMALVGKRDARDYRVFVLLSDGECDEGSVWEAALFAPHHRLDNLIVIIDYNKIQSLGAVSDILSLEPLAAKWEAFGWDVQEIDGHNFDQIEGALEHLPGAAEKPTCIIAHTIKGKGVDFMENQLLWHYRPPNDQELARALAQLEACE